MYPPIWGTLFHDFMLLSAQEYPTDPTEEDKSDMLYFIKYTFKRLPCPHCRAHAMSYLSKNPLDVASKKQLMQWLVTFHNHVNRRQKKRSNWTLAEALESQKKRLGSDLDALERANKIRIEDHEHIHQLEQQIIALKKQGPRPSEVPSEMPSEVPSEVTEVKDSDEKDTDQEDRKGIYQGHEQCPFRPEVRDDVEQFTFWCVIGLCIFIFLLLMISVVLLLKV